MSSLAITKFSLVYVPRLWVVVEARASLNFLDLGVSFLFAPAVDRDGLWEAVFRALVCLGQLVRCS